MKDTIFERQNDDEVLDLLYSQRVSYDHAEIFNRIGWTMTLLLLFLAVGCAQLRAWNSVGESPTV